VARIYDNMSGLLFITSAEADHKDISVALLHLRDMDRCPETDFMDIDIFRLVTTRNAQDIDVDSETTSPPVARDITNAWASASLEDVEAYCIELAQTGSHISTHKLVIIDSQGLKEKSCILGDLAWDFEAGLSVPDRFDRMRVPWEHVYSIWWRSSLGEMSITEHADSEPVQGWFTYGGHYCVVFAECVKRRDAAVKAVEAGEEILATPPPTRLPGGPGGLISAEFGRTG
jgi:hypothetical protein